MGWSSWNTFACNISEALIIETAEALISSGMRDAGYVYVNIDDCWSTMKRNTTGFVLGSAVSQSSFMQGHGGRPCEVPARNKISCRCDFFGLYCISFFCRLLDYLHARGLSIPITYTGYVTPSGLKLGLYSAAGLWAWRLAWMWKGREKLRLENQKGMRVCCREQASTRARDTLAPSSMKSKTPHFLQAGKSIISSRIGASLTLARSANSYYFSHRLSITRDRSKDPRVYYPIMRDALNATGRPIVYSICGLSHFVV